MSFIVTMVSEGAHSLRAPATKHVKLDRHRPTPFEAGYVPSLKRYLGRDVNGSSWLVLKPAADGYETSGGLFEYGSADDDAARLHIRDGAREEFNRALEAAIRDSLHGRAILILEYNGGVTDPEIGATAAASVDVHGPLGIEEFWTRHDLDEVLEDSVWTITG